jgi:hypothetical protein
MRRSLLLSAVVGGVGLLASPAWAQVNRAGGRDAQRADEWAPGTFMAQALGRVTELARRIAESEDVGLVRGTTCFLGALMDPGEKISMVYELQAGQTYVFVAAADEDAGDVDLHVLDSAGEMLEQDIELDPTPIVVFTPAKTGKYTMTLEMADAEIASFAAVAVLRKGEAPHSLDAITTCRNRILRAGEIAARQGRPVGFMDVENRWAIYGTILAKGESTTVTNVSTDGGDHLFVAVGDDDATDVDLKLMDGAGATVKEDVAADATPLFTMAMPSGRAFQLEISNADAKGPALVMASVLTLR